MILKLRAALEYPTFQVNCWVFRVLEERLAAIFACRTKHGTRWVAQETFLKTYVLVTGHPQSYLRTQGIWHYLLADWDQVTQEISRDIEKEWDESRRVKQYQLLVLQNVLKPGHTYIVLEELVLKIVRWKRRGILPRNCISEYSRLSRLPMLESQL